MTSSNGRLRQRRCSSADLGVDGAGTNRAWPDTEVSLASVAGADATYWLLTIPRAALAGEALTDFPGAGGPLRLPGAGIADPGVQPAGRAVPVGLAQGTRGRPDGIAESYYGFLAHARLPWMAALAETRPGPVPRRSRGSRRRPAVSDVRDERARVLAEARRGAWRAPMAIWGSGLLLLANPDLAGLVAMTMMSLGGVTKVRKMTGREFPVWVDLPAHQPALLASPVLARAWSDLCAKRDPRLSTLRRPIRRYQQGIVVGAVATGAVSESRSTRSSMPAVKAELRSAANTEEGARRQRRRSSPCRYRCSAARCRGPSRSPEPSTSSRHRCPRCRRHSSDEARTRVTAARPDPRPDVRLLERTVERAPSGAKAVGLRAYLVPQLALETPG